MALGPRAAHALCCCPRPEHHAAVGRLTPTLGLTGSTVLSNARPCPAKPASIQFHEGASRRVALGGVVQVAPRALRLRSSGAQRLPGSPAVRERKVSGSPSCSVNVAPQEGSLSLAVLAVHGAAVVRGQRWLVNPAAEQKAVSLAAQAFGQGLQRCVRQLSACSTRCGLTLRSWGLPPARHLARSRPSAWCRSTARTGWMRATQRATADSRVGTVSLTVCRPSSCM